MYASCFLSLISWILDSCVICASYNLFLYVYFSALISSASFRLLTAFLCSSCRSAFNFSKLLFSAFFSASQLLQQCYNTHCCNVWKENLQHLRSVLQSAVYLHLLLLLLSRFFLHSPIILFFFFCKFLFSLLLQSDFFKLLTLSDPSTRSASICSCIFSNIFVNRFQKYCFFFSRNDNAFFCHLPYPSLLQIFCTESQ